MTGWKSMLFGKLNIEQATIKAKGTEVHMLQDRFGE
jgi:hypothetical protein